MAYELESISMDTYKAVTKILINGNFSESTVVENLVRNHPEIFLECVNGGFTELYGMSMDLANRIKDEIDSGAFDSRFIQAIKDCRNETHADLKTAKDGVESFARKLGWIPHREREESRYEDQ